MKRQQSHATSNVKAACRACRASKTKCDGQRPMCSRCARKIRVSCEYDAEPDESRLTALKRECMALEQQASTHEVLLRHLINSSHDEAYDILKRMRAGDDDLSIFVGLLEKRSNYTNRDVVQSTATHKDGAAVFADSSDDRNSIAFLLARNSPTRAESE
ncbi:unnamed protein product [Zymoseptoria tritici ST99CH_3D1]|uniref:Zn(2)-C6 fungal-type domain-containing protein n=1 Tax=Zymoseptoria tritici (strain ST99CH_3D7) TaxID=1276538 RepID=A0A1X7S5B9_ZYMT9|nr:unnamed protein product [Zymoseptoria tritici ST99CH_3D7]SMR62677.1 unnamed protein product [Zymoseptoria tritici ST99CH_3D1]